MAGKKCTKVSAFLVLLVLSWGNVAAKSPRGGLKVR